MRRLVTLAVLAGLVLLLAAPSSAQQAGSDVRKELEALKEGQAKMQKDIQEIKALLQARPAAAPAGQPQTAVLTVENAPFKGEKNAKVTLVDFTDYQ